MIFFYLKALGLNFLQFPLGLVTDKRVPYALFPIAVDYDIFLLLGSRSKALSQARFAFPLQYL